MDEKKILTKDDILGLNDLPFEEIEVKEWGGIVRVRGLTSYERDEFESQSFVGEGKTRKFIYANMRARLISKTVCNENGDCLFSDADIEKLGKKSGKVMDRLFAVAQRLSGIGDKDLDDLIKNSEGERVGSPAIA